MGQLGRGHRALRDVGPEAGAEHSGAGGNQSRQLPPNPTLLSLCSLRQEQWMNVRVGDIIKLENNQFVAVSVAP